MLASSLLIRLLINTMELPFLVDKVNLTINKETYTVASSKPTRLHTAFDHTRIRICDSPGSGPYPSLFLRILLVAVLGISLSSDLVELCIFKLQRKAADIPPLLVN